MLVAPLLITACGTESTDLPPGLGPLASSSEVAFPADCQSATGTGSVTIGDVRAVLANPSYNERRAKGCVNYPLAQVWQALQIPTGVHIGFWPERNDNDCEAWLIIDPLYPVNFVTKEIPHGGIQSHYTFDVTWRAGVNQCGYRRMPITDSGASRSPIPAEADHRFRSKPIAERMTG